MGAKIINYSLHTISSLKISILNIYAKLMIFSVNVKYIEL